MHFHKIEENNRKAEESFMRNKFKEKKQKSQSLNRSLQEIPQYRQSLLLIDEGAKRKNSNSQLMNKSSNAILNIKQRNNSIERSKVSKPTQTKNYSSSSFSSAQFGNQVLQNTLMSTIENRKKSVINSQQKYKVLSQNHILQNTQKEHKKSQLHSLPLSGATTPTSRLLTPQQDGKGMKIQPDSIHLPTSTTAIGRLSGAVKSISKITNQTLKNYYSRVKMNMITPNSTLDPATTKPTTPLFTNTISAVKHRQQVKRKQMLNFSDVSKKEFSPSPDSISNQILKHVYSQESKHSQMRKFSLQNGRTDCISYNMTPGAMHNAFTIKNSKLKTILVPKKEFTSSVPVTNNSLSSKYPQPKKGKIGQQFERETSKFGWNSQNQRFFLGTPRKVAVTHLKQNFKSLLPSKCGQFSLRLNF